MVVLSSCGMRNQDLARHWHPMIWFARWVLQKCLLLQTDQVLQIHGQMISANLSAGDTNYVLCQIQMH